MSNDNQYLDKKNIKEQEMSSKNLDNKECGIIYNDARVTRYEVFENGDLKLKENNINMAFFLYQEKLDQLSQVYGKDSHKFQSLLLEKIDWLIKKSKILLKKNNFQKSEAILAKSLPLIRIYGTSDFVKRKIEILNTLSCCSRRTGNLKQSIDYLQQALRFGKSTKENLGLTYVNLTAVYSELGDYTTALKMSKESIFELSQAALVDKDQQLMKMLLIAYYNNGSMEINLRKYQNGIKVLEKGKELVRKYQIIEDEGIVDNITEKLAEARNKFINQTRSYNSSPLKNNSRDNTVHKSGKRGSSSGQQNTNRIFSNGNTLRERQQKATNERESVRKDLCLDHKYLSNRQSCNSILNILNKDSKFDSTGQKATNVNSNHVRLLKTKPFLGHSKRLVAGADWQDPNLKVDQKIKAKVLNKQQQKTPSNDFHEKSSSNAFFRGMDKHFSYANIKALNYNNREEETDLKIFNESFATKLSKNNDSHDHKFAKGKNSQITLHDFNVKPFYLADKYSGLRETENNKFIVLDQNFSMISQGNFGRNSQRSSPYMQRLSEQSNKVLSVENTKQNLSVKGNIRKEIARTSNKSHTAFDGNCKMFNYEIPKKKKINYGSLAGKDNNAFIRNSERRKNAKTGIPTGRFLAECYKQKDKVLEDQVLLTWDEDCQERIGVRQTESGVDVEEDNLVKNRNNLLWNLKKFNHELDKVNKERELQKQIIQTAEQFKKSGEPNKARLEAADSLSSRKNICFKKIDMKRVHSENSPQNSGQDSPFLFIQKSKAKILGTPICSFQKSTKSSYMKYEKNNDKEDSGKIVSPKNKFFSDFEKQMSSSSHNIVIGDSINLKQELREIVSEQKFENELCLKNLENNGKVMLDRMETFADNGDEVLINRVSTGLPKMSTYDLMDLKKSQESDSCPNLRSESSKNSDRIIFASSKNTNTKTDTQYDTCCFNSAYYTGNFGQDSSEKYADNKFLQKSETNDSDPFAKQENRFNYPDSNLPHSKTGGQFSSDPQIIQSKSFETFLNDNYEKALKSAKIIQNNWLKKLDSDKVFVKKVEKRECVTQIDKMVIKVFDANTNFEEPYKVFIFEDKTQHHPMFFFLARHLNNNKKVFSLQANEKLLDSMALTIHTNTNSENNKPQTIFSSCCRELLDSIVISKTNDNQKNPSSYNSKNGKQSSDSNGNEFGLASEIASKVFFGQSSIDDATNGICFGNIIGINRNRKRHNSNPCNNLGYMSDKGIGYHQKSKPSRFSTDFNIVVEENIEKEDTQNTDEEVIQEDTGNIDMSRKSQTCVVKSAESQLGSSEKKRKQTNTESSSSSQSDEISRSSSQSSMNKGDKNKMMASSLLIEPNTLTMTNQVMGDKKNRPQDQLTSQIQGLGLHTAVNRYSIVGKNQQIDSEEYLPDSENKQKSENSLMAPGLLPQNQQFSNIGEEITSLGISNDPRKFSVLGTGNQVDSEEVLPPTNEIKEKKYSRQFTEICNVSNDLIDSRNFVEKSKKKNSGNEDLVAEALKESGRVGYENIYQDILLFNNNQIEYNIIFAKLVRDFRETIVIYAYNPSNPNDYFEPYHMSWLFSKIYLNNSDKPETWKNLLNDLFFNREKMIVSLREDKDISSSSNFGTKDIDFAFKGQLARSDTEKFEESFKKFERHLSTDQSNLENMQKSIDKVRFFLIKKKKV